MEIPTCMMMKEMKLWVIITFFCDLISRNAVV